MPMSAFHYTFFMSIVFLKFSLNMLSKLLISAKFHDYNMLRIIEYVVIDGQSFDLRGHCTN